MHAKDLSYEAEEPTRQSGRATAKPPGKQTGVGGRHHRLLYVICSGDDEGKGFYIRIIL